MFRFKQFTIHQDKTAMKVCTDACLFGALVVHEIEQKEIVADSILDIGTGTGLLSLMLAQKTNALIDAVEINEQAFKQAGENIAASSWKDRINMHHCSITDYSPGKKYDLIICNPPFYEKHLVSPDEGRNTAMHTGSLSFAVLAEQIKRLLSPTGNAAVLLPYDQVAVFEDHLRKQEFMITQSVNISHSPEHRFFRTVLFFSQAAQQQKESGLSIKDNTGAYSTAFKFLLKDYYLAL